MTKENVIIALVAFVAGFAVSWIFKTALLADIAKLAARVGALEGQVKSAATAVAADVKKV